MPGSTRPGPPAGQGASAWPHPGRRRRHPGCSERPCAPARKDSRRPQRPLRPSPAHPPAPPPPARRSGASAARQRAGCGPRLDGVGSRPQLGQHLRPTGQLLGGRGGDPRRAWSAGGSWRLQCHPPPSQLPETPLGRDGGCPRGAWAGMGGHLATEPTAAATPDAARPRPGVAGCRGTVDPGGPRPGKRPPADHRRPCLATLRTLAPRWSVDW